MNKIVKFRYNNDIQNKREERYKGVYNYGEFSKIYAELLEPL